MLSVLYTPYSVKKCLIPLSPFFCATGKGALVKPALRAVPGMGACRATCGFCYVNTGFYPDATAIVPPFELPKLAQASRKHHGA